MFSKLFTLFFLTASTITITALAAAPPLVTRYVRINTKYDNGNLSLHNVACSHGENGFLTRGYTTLNSLPPYPYVGAARFVEGLNSNQCGSCYRMLYQDRSIYFMAIDTMDGVDAAFAVSTAAMGELAGQETEPWVEIDALVEQVDAHHCGI